MMSSFRQSIWAGVLCSAALWSTGCASDTGAQEVEAQRSALKSSSGSVVDVVASDPNYSTLVAAVKAAGLVDALADGEAKYTVFAPTNAAFERALSKLGLSAEQLLSDANKELVKQILLYHVIKGEVRASAVRAAAGSEVPTLEGESIRVSVSPFGVIQLNDGVYVRRTDIDTTNGVIHSLSGVLLPPSAKL